MADVLPLRSAPADPPTVTAGPVPILVDARTAAVMLGVGLRTFRTMDAAGRIPAPVRLSPGCVRWRLDELRAWADAGAPCRTDWERVSSTRSK